MVTTGSHYHMPNNDHASAYGYTLFNVALSCFLIAVPISQLSAECLIRGDTFTFIIVGWHNV